LLDTVSCLTLISRMIADLKKTIALKKIKIYIYAIYNVYKCMRNNVACFPGIISSTQSVMINLFSSGTV